MEIIIKANVDDKKSNSPPLYHAPALPIDKIIALNIEGVER